MAADMNAVKQAPGFSLVELMVVIAVIAILVGVGFIAFNNTGPRGRDAERQADIDNLRSGLEVSRNQKGIYPLIASVVNGFLPNVPADSYIAPGQSTNSLTTTTTPTASQYGYVTYLPNGTSCTTGTTCGAKYKIYWYDEASKTVQVKESTY